MVGKRIKNIIIYGILILGAIVVLYPFFYMIINSLKQGPEIMHNPTALPKEISFDGYRELFKSLNIGRLFFNSLLIAGSIAFLNVVFCSMVAKVVQRTNL